MEINKTNALAKPPRASNIELFRILVMFFIVAHHYVTSSGLTLETGPIFSVPLSWRSIFLLLLGAWGKTGINCFVLITGYFMCKSRLTAKKFLTLLLEVIFYRVVIALIFLLFGNHPIPLKELILSVLPITEIAQGFTGTFLCFYLCIPFCNILIHNLTEKQHIYLLLLSGFIYIFFGTIKILPVTMNYVSWFIVLYFIASYIRLYPKAIFDSKKLWGWLSLFFIGVSILSVLACSWLGARIGRNSPYAFVADSNTFLAVAVGVSTFLFFKNINLPHSKLINTISSTTFGIFLIHTNTYLRKWLWTDVFHCVENYYSPWLPLIAIFGSALILIVCSGIDLSRQYLLEKPFFRLWDRLWPNITKTWKHLEDKFFKKCKISND